MVGVDKIKIFLALVLVSLVAISTTNAVDLSITVKTIEGTASPGDMLAYNITFYNLDDNDVALSTNMFIGAPEFLPSNAFVVPAKEAYTMSLNIGIDQSDANVLGSPTGKTTYQKLLVFDEDGAQLDYNVLIPIKIINPVAEAEWSVVGYSNPRTLPARIDPRQPFSVRFTLNNPVKQVTVDTAIESADFVIESGTLVVPNGTNDLTLTNLEIPAGTQPGTYDVNVRVLLPDYTLVVPVTINVGGYSDCTITDDLTSGILGKSYSASATVEGTEAKTCTISTPLFGLERRLITEITDGFEYTDKEVMWQLTVQPGETKQVSYELNYLPIIVIPFVVVFLAAAWWYLTRKVEIVKELVDYRRHPGFMDLKIQLRVRNLSSMELDRVKIVEQLPAFVKEIRDFGTVPGEVSKHKGRKAIKWNLEHLKPKEERVFSYKFRTSVEVLGRMNFPPTTITYKTPKGERLEETSNILSVEVE